MNCASFLYTHIGIVLRTLILFSCESVVYVNCCVENERMHRLAGVWLV